MEGTSTRLLLALLFTGTLMGALDLAIIGPALPVIQAEFGMQQRELAGLINAYTLLQMIGALLLAKLADRYGARAIYLTSIIFFAAGSLLIVVADAAWMLYLGRALQGFGAGGFFPASAAVIGSRLKPAERGQALGILGMVWGVAFIAGPILGGIFLRFSWHWLFAINLPIAAVLIVGAIKLLPSEKNTPKPFDLKGMIILLFAMSALVMAVTEIDTKDPLGSLLSMTVGGGFVLMLLFTAIFWFIENRAHDPIVKPALFHSSQISRSCLITAGSSAIQSGVIFLPALLVGALDVSPANSSLLLLPGVIAATFAAPTFGKLINKTGTRLIIVCSQMLVVAGLMIYAFTELNFITFLFASIISGIGSAGLVGAPIRYIVLNETGSEDRASAQGLISVVSSTGRLLGASVVGAVATSLGGGVIGYQAAFGGLVLLGIVVLIIASTLNSKETEQSAWAKSA